MHRTKCLKLLFISALFAGFSGCTEDSQKDSSTGLLNLVDQNGNTQLELEMCGASDTLYAILSTPPTVQDVQLVLQPDVEGLLKIVPTNDSVFDANATLLTYSIQCNEAASSVSEQGTQIMAVTHSADAALDHLTATFKVNCVRKSACGAPPAPNCSDYPACLAEPTCNASNGCKAPGSAGVRIVPLSGLRTTESGGKDAFSIVLDTQPQADVTISFTSDNPSEGTISPNKIVFTPNNWDTVQTIEVIGEDDSMQDGDQTWHVQTQVTSTDKDYNGLVVAQISVTNEDNEAPAEPASFTIKVNKVPVKQAKFELWETGLSDYLTIVSDTAPIADVTVQLVSLDDSEVKVISDPIVFTKLSWNSAKKLFIRAVPDGIVDGDQIAEVKFVITSEDSRFNGFELPNILVTVHDTDEEITGPVTLRMMAANTTTGKDQSYDLGEGKRIFQAMKPDIVMIQEFNMETDTIDNFVRSTFGNSYDYYRGTGDIPNGIISRYPIIDKGQWSSPQISNRGFNWAIIDIPGDKDLLAISVHLSTETNKQISEMVNLDKRISEVSKGKYVVLGGDFNTASHNVVRTNFETAFPMHVNYANDDTKWPMDQKGNINTNAKRANPYDYVLSSDDLFELEVPVVIGAGTPYEHAYKHGHVFDSRVYSSLGELSVVAPVLADDSGAENMQHMAVIRDFQITP